MQKKIKFKTPMQSLRGVLSNFHSKISPACTTIKDFQKASNQRPTHRIHGRKEIKEDFLRVFVLSDGCYISIQFNFLDPKTNRTIESEKQSIELKLINSEDYVFHSLAYPIEEFRVKIKDFYSNFNLLKEREDNYLRNESDIIIEKLVEHFKLKDSIDENKTLIQNNISEDLSLELENLVHIDNELIELNKKLTDRNNVIYQLKNESEEALEIKAMEKELQKRKIELDKKVQDKNRELCISELRRLIKKSEDARYNIEDLISYTIKEINIDKQYHLPKKEIEKIIKKLVS